MSGGTPSGGGGGGAEFNTFTSASTWNPEKQDETAQITIDDSGLTNGSYSINVDGSTVSSYDSGSGVNTKIVNPSSSLSVVSANKNYDLVSASYDSKNKSISTYYQGMFFKPDGLKWYSAGYDGLTEYDMSTAFDISTSSVNDTFALRPTTEFTTAVFFKPDGTKAWVSGQVSSDPIREITLSTAWDVSSASYSGTTFTPNASYNTKGIHFKSDGSKIYALTSDDSVREFDLSTAWNISTASSLVNSFSTTSQDNDMEGLDMKSGGNGYFLVGNQNDKVYEYSMSTLWDISTSSYVRSFSLASQTTDPSSVRFANSGAKMYVMRRDSRVYQYSSVSTYSGTFRASII